MFRLRATLDEWKRRTFQTLFLNQQNFLKRPWDQQNITNNIINDARQSGCLWPDMNPPFLRMISSGRFISSLFFARFHHMFLTKYFLKVANVILSGDDSSCQIFFPLGTEFVPHLDIVGSAVIDLFNYGLKHLFINDYNVTLQFQVLVMNAKTTPSTLLYASPSGGFQDAKKHLHAIQATMLAAQSTDEFRDDFRERLELNESAEGSEILHNSFNGMVTALMQSLSVRDFRRFAETANVYPLIVVKMFTAAYGNNRFDARPKQNIGAIEPLAIEAMRLLVQRCNIGLQNVNKRIVTPDNRLWRTAMYEVISN